MVDGILDRTFADEAHRIVTEGGGPGIEPRAGLPAAVPAALVAADQVVRDLIAGLPPAFTAAVPQSAIAVVAMLCRFVCQYRIV